MGSDWVRDVADFHEKYLVDIPNQPEGMLIEAQELHRMKLFLEEFKEFCDAVEKKDFVEYYWLTPQEVLNKIDEGDKAKDDLPKLVKLFYMS